MEKTKKSTILGTSLPPDGMAVNSAHVLLLHELKSLPSPTGACPMPRMGTSRVFGACLHTGEGRTPLSGSLTSLGLQTPHQQTRTKTPGSNLVLLTDTRKDFHQIGSGSAWQMTFGNQEGRLAHELSLQMAEITRN